MISLKRPDGFSLIELMVAGGIASFAILSTTMAIEHVNRLRSDLDAKTLLELQSYDIRSFLSDPVTCSSNFVGLRQDLALDIAGVDVPALKYVSGVDANGNQLLGDVFLQVGLNSSGVKISSLKLVPVRKIDDSKTYSELVMSSATQQNMQPIKIGLILTSNAGLVTNCVQVGAGNNLTSQSVCDLISGKWDTSTQTCVIPKVYYCTPPGGAKATATCPPTYKPYHYVGRPRAECWWTEPDPGTPEYDALLAKIPTLNFNFTSGVSETQFAALADIDDNSPNSCTATYADAIADNPDAYGVSLFIYCVSTSTSPITPPATCHER